MNPEKYIRKNCKAFSLPVILMTAVVSMVSVSQVLASGNNGFKELQFRMVEEQIVARGVECPLTLRAMREVPRHRFVPERQIRNAYEDRPLPIGHGQTISQPYIVALMTQLARPATYHTVLEIGTGSGYQAAVLSPIVKEVYSIEIIKALAESSKEAIVSVGYENIFLKHADGYYGWEDAAPFDSIIVTAAAPYIPPPLVEQLRPGGVMIIPVGGVFQVQRLMLVEKDEDGSVSSRSIMPVRFVPFTRDN